VEIWIPPNNPNNIRINNSKGLDEYNNFNAKYATDKNIGLLTEFMQP